jgi:hypothetical protein
MPRQMSTAYWSGSTLATSDEDFLVLLDITHESIEPIYVVSDVLDVVSNGITYTGFPFEWVMPQEDDEIPRGKLRIQNVDKRIGLALHSLRTPPYIKVQVVLKSDPDEALLNYRFLRLTNVSVDAVAVEGDVGITDFTSIPWPRTRAVKRLLPGLFKVPGG